MSEYELDEKSLSKLHFFTSATDYCIAKQKKQLITNVSKLHLLIIITI